MLRKVYQFLCVLAVGFSPLIQSQELEDEQLLFDPNTRLLQANQSLLLQSSQFDWSVGWFRYRGFDPSRTYYYMGKILLNTPAQGVIDWNRWGGLNDITRYPDQLQYGSSQNYLGSAGGYSAITPSELFGLSRLRLTLSSSNRSYRRRLMLTLYDRFGNFDWLLSAGVRNANTGYYEATPYQSTSLFGQLRFRKGPIAISLFQINTDTRRVSPEAHTEEVWSLVGDKYHSSWGFLNHEIIPLKTKSHTHKHYQFEFDYKSDPVQFTLSLMHYKQSYSRTTLSYQLAPNPWPTYYKNLPSYYRTKPFMAARQLGALQLTQGVDIASLIYANTQKDPYARYSLVSDTSDSSQQAASLFLVYESSNHTLSIWSQIDRQQSLYYQYLENLLGAKYYRNEDLYEGFSYDLNTENQKYTGERINYDYRLTSFRLLTSLFYKWSGDAIDFSYRGAIGSTSASRHSDVQHERYRESRQSSFKTARYYHHEATSNWYLTAKQEVQFKVMDKIEPYPWEKRLVNARYSHQISELDTYRLRSLELEYRYQYGRLALNTKVFAFKETGGLETGFYFAQHTDWADLISERIEHTVKSGSGISADFALELSSELQLSGVGYLFNSRYRSLGVGTLHRPASENGQLQTASLTFEHPHELMVPSGPSRAFTLALRYSHPSYWGLTVKAVGLSGTYLEPEWPRYDKQFLEDLSSYTAYTPYQERLPSMLTFHLLVSKSWRVEKGYLQLFVSLSNLMNRIQPIAGYGSSRLLLAKDYAKDLSSKVFDTKTWRSQGFTYFFNLSYRH